jgi:hypothetical protein
VEVRLNDGSFPIAKLPVFVVCNSVQRKSEHAATIGHERPPNEKADPGFPRSASVCLNFIQLEGLAVAIP